MTDTAQLAVTLRMPFGPRRILVCLDETTVPTEVADKVLEIITSLEVGEPSIELQTPPAETPAPATSSSSKAPKKKATPKQPTAIHACIECGKTFASPNGLSIHKGRAHGAKAAAQADPPPVVKPANVVGDKPAANGRSGPKLECEDCGERFDTDRVRDLGRHVQEAHKRSLHPEERRPVQSLAKAAAE